ncbi:hypothetical protein BHE74_00045765 [Ensete ventricosum]|nr:hypothetical protein BHE74_00045765 [Ensete ventricosum]RZS17730.1 hypothetical protein BHM03_00049917 [Ensete ventricosum]
MSLGRKVGFRAGFVFAMPETSLGLFPDIGASYFLSRLPGFFGSTFANLTFCLSVIPAKSCICCFAVEVDKLHFL